MSIRIKILLSVGLVMMSVLGVGSYSYVRLLERDYQESIAWNSETLAQILVQEIIEAYTYVPNIQSLLDGFTIRCLELFDANTSRRISYVAVINASQVFAAHSEVELLGQKSGAFPSDQEFPPQESRTFLDRESYRTFVPVFGTEENVYIGAVEIGVPRRIIKEKIRQALLQAATVLIPLLALAFSGLALLIHLLITKPLRSLAAFSKRLARGQFDRLPAQHPRHPLRNNASSRDEILILRKVFHSMVDYLQEKADIANRISSGDVRQEVVLRSETDVLGNAFRRMTEYLQNMATVSMAIAQGDLRRKIQPQGEHDLLGNSSRQMLLFLQQVATVSEKISQGDLMVEVSMRSEEDVLNQSLQNMIAYLRTVARVAQEISQNNLYVGIYPNSSRDMLNSSLQQMLGTLQTADERVKRSLAEIELQNWFRNGQIELSDLMRGEQDSQTLADRVITYLAKYLQAQVGILYLPDTQHGERVMRAAGGYACSCPREMPRQFAIGEGVIGQAALTRKTLVLDDVPGDHLSILCGLGQATPRNILVVPLIHNNEARGVIELGSAYEFSKQHREFLAQAQETIAISFHSAHTRHQMERLLQETQIQAETLEKQEQQLRQANEGLEEQTAALRLSEEKLHMQQEELRQTNEELSGQSTLLAGQKVELEKKNAALEQARRLVEEKAADLELSKELLEEKMRELERSERYKTDFLANMSHELRTPLNSLLILAKLLQDNKEGNLTPKQVEHAHTIYEAGSALLELLNEILDLSKVETGKMLLNLEEMSLAGLTKYIRQHFAHVAEQKGLRLSIELADALPPTLNTDRQRVEQILRNLLSNALKFTTQGTITLSIHRAESVANAFDAAPAIAFAVSDTGPGIPTDKQQCIFEAFQQLDSTISRQYGGTGLGLSISRKLSRLLGGELRVESETGRGSTFTLYVPEDAVQQRANDIPSGLSHKRSPDETAQPSQGVESIRDDRLESESSVASLLIIEHNPEWAKMIFSLTRDRGFRGLVAGDGEAGLQMAYQYKPQAIVLDLNLPRMNGRTVLERLRSAPETRHIPIHTLTASGSQDAEESIQDELILFMHKTAATLPEGAQKKTRMSHDKNLVFRDKVILFVDDDIRNSYALKSVLEERAMQVILAANGQEALSLLEKGRHIDLILMDIMMPVMDGYEAIRRIRRQPGFQRLPIIAFTANSQRGDRQKSIEVGANDYLSKPIDIDKLLSLLRVWLY